MSDASYVVVHETRYEYEQPVGISRQVVHLTPRATSWQTCKRHRLEVTPKPDQLARSVDAFGNEIASFCIEADHSSLSVRAESWVELSARTLPREDQTPAWDAVQARLAYQAGLRPDTDDLDATRYLFESTRVRNKRELAAWSAACFPNGTPLLAGVRALMERIHRELTFDPKATIVSTPVMEVFARRRGVCQDFAHLMLSCLRSLGLSARYVSGYVLTRPPPGRPRLVGADASHAWVSVYCPGHGWIDADPTNGVFPSLEHVTLGWGRDYDDVIPLRGVLLGGGSHTLEIEVTVAPAADYDTLFGALAESRVQ
jgi:transglutaminase-like putative cysteine protease